MQRGGPRGSRDIDDLGWLEAPSWLDAVDAADVLADADVLAAPPDGELFAPLSVGQVLGVVELAGPGPEAIRLLASLSGRVLSADQRLSVVQLMQAQVAWVAGAEQQSIVDLVGPAAPPAVPAGASLEDPAVLAARKAALAEEFWPVELAPALHTSVDQAKAGSRRPGCSRVSGRCWGTGCGPGRWTRTGSG